jgi:adenylate cyclase
LDALGLELARMAVQYRALHPQVQVKNFVFTRDPENPVLALMRVAQVKAHTLAYGNVWEIERSYGSLETEAFRLSPLWLIAQGQDEVRCRIDPKATSFPHPVLADLRDLGCTDYIALALVSVDGERSGLSVTTRKAGGFSESDLAVLRAVLLPLSMCIEIHAQRQVTRALLRTYLGSEPGQRVLSGHIQRGDVESLEAAIWFSDIRGFTLRSAELDAPTLIHWLNAYFGAIAPAIEQQGGEILKFIGDAVLAVFPVSAERSAAQACAAALQAARNANAAVDALNESASEPYAHGIALHLGQVQYGNIGSEHRLDFTVIGPAVNLASRVEGLCSRLGHKTLATEALAELAGEALGEAGTFDLKGISEPQRVFVVA